MFKPKNVLVPATGALVLSFLVSIISTGNFGSSLFRAILFFLLFALLGGIISFLNDRFLSTGDDYSSGGEEGVSRRSSGNVVDIVINDENLTDDGDSPHFNVDHNSRTLGERDTVAPSVSAAAESRPVNTVNEAAVETVSVQNAESAGTLQNEAAPVQNQNPPPSDFVPVTPGQKPAAAKTAQSAPSAPVQKVNTERAAQMKEIDDLPDLGSADDDSSGDEGLIESSDFASLGESTEDEKVSVVDGEKAKDHDTETMAKAIRTLLKRE
ncbi:hypothetical protein [Treponema sp.]|uniref:hypothetical protein n=1 Tax=Treponema sp. TaxID=166 RepID=UPI0025E54917|nr:hypothetical protein [Treponema sp.]MCR5217236.1 hypothetical protein [Treponema sp.]